MTGNLTEETSKTSVLLIYTGGTIGMRENPVTGALEPLEFSHILRHVPELGRLGYRIESHQFSPPIDSSSMVPGHWVEIADVIARRYDEFDGFVILHGTDTMAYTASALSFMLENLSKPVVLTGSQLPIGRIRTDGKENLITAIEIAARKRPDGSAMVPEVCIFFQSELLRGNRTTKIYAENLNAFRSYNYPPLAKVGIEISFNDQVIQKPGWMQPLVVHRHLDTHIVVLTLFPGLGRDVVLSILNTPKVRAIILKTFGSGNAPELQWFTDLIQQARQRGIIVVNITQCQSGKVEMGRYEAGRRLLEAGVVSGMDSTMESAITKLMRLLAEEKDPSSIARLMGCSLAGEITV